MSAQRTQHQENRATIPVTTGLRLIAAVNAATTEITPYAMTSNGILHNTASPTVDVVEAPARMRATGYSDPPAPFLITDTTTAGTIDTKSSTKPSRRASATAVRKRTCAVAGDLENQKGTTLQVGARERCDNHGQQQK